MRESFIVTANSADESQPSSKQRPMTEDAREQVANQKGDNRPDDISSAVARAAESHPDDIDKQIEVALQCPCVEDMMTSPCKDTFVDSFSCFMKSNEEIKGYDCVEHFERFQACLVANPGIIDDFLTSKSEMGEATV